MQNSVHSIALRDPFNGHTTVVEADEIHLCIPTRECVQFWVTVAACLIALALGVFFMVWQGSQSAYFFIGEGLLGLSIGVLIPGPDYRSMRQPTRSRPGSPNRDAEPEPTHPHAHTSAPPRVSLPDGYV